MNIDLAIKNLANNTKKETEGMNFDGFLDAFIPKLKKDYTVKREFLKFFKGNNALVRTVDKNCRASGVMTNNETMLEMEVPVDLKQGEKYVAIYNDAEEKFELFHIMKIGQTKKIAKLET